MDENASGWWRTGRRRAGSLLILSVCIQLAALGVAAETFGQSGRRPEPQVSNVWVDMPLSQVVRDISMQVGMTIAVDPSVAYQLVSLEVVDVPLEECLNKLTAGQGLMVRKLDEGLYVIGSGKPDSPSFDQLSESKRVYLKYITERHLKNSLPRSLQPYVASGERKTEVLVVAPVEKMKRITEIIEQIDVPRRQVVLEALVVELSQEGTRRLGIDWERSGPNTLFSLSESTDAFLGTARYTSVPERNLRTLQLTLHMLVSEGQATIRSRPRVATLNGEEALIDVSLEEYFNIVTDLNGAYLRTELQVVKSGVVLRMTPQIGAGDDITVKVSTEVSDVATRRSNVAAGNGQVDTLPVIRRRKADARVRVKQGDAIVIGGLVETQERDEVKKVPVLGSIPLLGALFRSTKKVTIQKEVVIFITPRVMEQGESPLAERHEYVDVEEELEGLRAGPAGPSSAEQPGPP